MATTIGQNVTATVKDGKLTITIDLHADTSASTSGKSDVVATTRGNVVVPGAADTDGRPLTLGVNGYFRK